MANIDTSKISGYDEMSADEKVAALEKFEFGTDVVSAAEYERLKSALSKSNSEAADYKKQLRAKQSEDEVRAAENAEKYGAMEKELEALRKEKTVATHKAAYLSLGYDDDSAQKSADALADGRLDEVFAIQKKVIETIKKESVSRAADRMPGITSGDPLTGMDAEKAIEAKLRQFMKLPPK